MTLDVDLLEESYDVVAPRCADVADRFYARLFELEPSLRERYAGVDLMARKREMLSALAVLRYSWRHIEAVVPLVAAQGAFHYRLGTRDEHFGSVGIALLDALADVGGPAWKPAYVSAWTAAYTRLWEVLCRGAQSCRAADEVATTLVA